MNQVRVAVLSNFAWLVENLGGNADEILAEHGLSRQFIEAASVDSYMPYEQAEAILQSASDATGCAHIGMLLGKEGGINLLGAVGYLMMQSATIDDALRVLSEHFSFHVKEAAVVEWSIDNNYASIIYKIVKPMKSINQGVELGIANLLAFFRQVNGANWYPAAVNFTHQEPSNLKPYHHFFGSNLRFNQEDNEIILSCDNLQNTIELGEPVLKGILESHLAQSAVDKKSNLSHLIITRLHENLPLGNVSIEYFSNILSIHPRTLHRKLVKEGTSFTQLLDSTRKSMALERIVHSNISIVRLALYLGYSDTSAFSRAFKRWTGVSPRVWRVNNH